MAHVSHFKKFPKNAQSDVQRLLLLPNASASLREYLIRSWEMPVFLDATSLEDANQKIASQLGNAALQFPNLAAEQLDSVVRLRGIVENILNVAVARRASLDDVPDFLNWIDVLCRLRQTRVTPDPYPSGVLLLGEIDRARSLFQRVPCEGHLAVIDYGWIYPETVRALVDSDTARLQRCVDLIPKVPKRNIRPWLETLFAVLVAANSGNATEVARQLAAHLEAMINLKHKGELANVLIWDAHTLYRAIEAWRPELVAEFDVTQPYPWDSAVHAAVSLRRSAGKDPLIDCDLNGLPPLLEELILKQNVPHWLQIHSQVWEFVLMSADPANKELLVHIEGMAGGNGKNMAAKLLIQHATTDRPISLRWGTGTHMKAYFDANAALMKEQGAKVAVRERVGVKFPYLIAPDQTWIGGL